MRWRMDGRRRKGRKKGKAAWLWRHTNPVLGLLSIMSLLKVCYLNSSSWVWAFQACRIKPPFEQVSKTQRMVQCGCMLAEREPCTYIFSADRSYTKAMTQFQARMICAWALFKTHTVWFNNLNSWKGWNSTCSVLCAFRNVYVHALYVNVCASQPLVTLVLRLSLSPALLHWFVYDGSALREQHVGF